MKKLLAGLAFAMTIGAVSMGSAQAATKIIFPKGSYCGSYSGDFRKSKTFSIYLLEGQTFEVKSADSADTITVKDSRGVLDGTWSTSTSYQVTTRKKGMHYVTLRSPKSYQEVQFCAN